MNRDEIIKEIEHLNYCIKVLTEKKESLQKSLNAGIEVTCTKDIRQVCATNAISFALENDMTIYSVMIEMFKLGNDRRLHSTGFGTITWMFRVCTGITQEELCDKILNIPQSFYVRLCWGTFEEVKHDFTSSSICASIADALGISKAQVCTILTNRYTYDHCVELAMPIILFIIENREWVFKRIPTKIYEQLSEGLR